MKTPLIIAKIGGKLIDTPELLNEFLADFASLKTPKILVHGGGNIASELAKTMGITPKMHNGRRITDAQTLDIVTMTYAGLINKNIVAQLQKLGCNSLGLSGADANSIKAHKRPVKDIDYGFAGDIDAIDSDMLTALLGLGLTPVFCALSHDQKGQLLNTNADTIAASLASALSDSFAVSLYYCFDKKGVLLDVNDNNSVIESIDRSQYKTLKEQGIIAAGMLPKLHNCFMALENEVVKVCIGDATIFKKKRQLYTTLTL